MTRPIVRQPGWMARLDAYVDGVRREPFDYGRFDCGIFAAGAIEAITQTRVMRAHWRRYTTLRGALGVMRRAGFDNLGDLAASLFPEIHPSQAYAGDIAAIANDGPFGFALGVVAGERIFVIGEEFDGLGTVDLLSAARAFRVE